jgi:hypothetical protein
LQAEGQRPISLKNTDTNDQGLLWRRQLHPSGKKDSARTAG